MSKKVTCVDLAINPFHTVVPVFFSSSCNQQCLTSRCFILPTPLLRQKALATSASVCKTRCIRAIPLSPLLSTCCRVVLQPSNSLQMQISLDAVWLARSRHVSCHASRALDVSHRFFYQLSP